MISLDQLSEQDIHNRLDQAYADTTENGFISAFLADAPRPSAVLVPLLRAATEESNIPQWHILLTKRSSTLSEHSGQIAFPGGRSDPDDSSPISTALREAQEEIGIESKNVHILGLIDSLLTITNYRITPVVGIIPWPAKLKLSHNEVERVFTIPLNWLAKPGNYEIHNTVLPPHYSLYYGSDNHPVIYFHPYKGDILWGASAEITMRLLKVLTK